ncbi:MAG: glutamyl-tRNA amidotransferase [Pseudonocardia sp. SCN 72-86]|nr:MAG: glutamyl-tRNA amidotransferase [Pseudonocardia sp. SCN 72-86]
MIRPVPDGFVDGRRLPVDGAPDGPLAGLTFATKDLFDVAGHRTGAGNPDWNPDAAAPTRHAWAVEQLLTNGMSHVGKTITCEISLGILGFNPHDGTPPNPVVPGAFPGGSSSGAAWAVAAGACDGALATDSGGSTRVPASFCGLFGLRPTHGRVPLEGVVAQAPTFDTVGWLARDADVFARMSEVLLAERAGVAPRYGLLVADDAVALADDAVTEALQPAVRMLSDLLGGARAVTLGPLAEWGAHRQTLQSAEAWRTFGPWIGSVNPRLGSSVARDLVAAAAIDDTAVAAAAGVRDEVRARIDELLGSGALLCLPTTPFPAPPATGDVAGLDALSARLGVLNSVAGMAGAPQVSIPAGRVDGRPVGISLVAAPGHDAALVAVAAAVGRSLAADPA